MSRHRSLIPGVNKAVKVSLPICSTASSPISSSGEGGLEHDSPKLAAAMGAILYISFSVAHEQVNTRFLISADSAGRYELIVKHTFLVEHNLCRGEQSLGCLESGDMIEMPVCLRS